MRIYYGFFVDIGHNFFFQNSFGLSYLYQSLNNFEFFFIRIPSGDNSTMNFLDIKMNNRGAPSLRGQSWGTTAEVGGVAFWQQEQLSALAPRNQKRCGKRIWIPSPPTKIITKYYIHNISQIIGLCMSIKMINNQMNQNWLILKRGEWKRNWQTPRGNFY